MKKPKTKKRRSIFLRVLLVAFLCYAVGSFVQLQAELSDRNNQLNELNAKIDQQQQTNKEYDTMLKEDNYSQYIAKIAREKLGYIYPDERIFVDVSGN